MTCGNCGSPQVVPTDVPDAKEEGYFVEHWRCEHCAATGTVKGFEDEPSSDWDYHGTLYE